MASNGKKLRSRDMVDCLQWKPGSYYVVVSSSSGSSRSSQSHEDRIEPCQVVQHSFKNARFLIFRSLLCLLFTQLQLSRYIEKFCFYSTCYLPSVELSWIVSDMSVPGSIIN